MVARLVIAAPASGHGKTTVATGLIAALVARGVQATGFKVGPDYIDPTYHALASGRPGRNLDPVLVGEDLIAPLFKHSAAEVSIVEGVMGLYDGRTGAGEFGSTAHVARLLNAPIVLVVDATGMGRSIAALIHGYRTFGDVNIAGVILNRVGSDRHESLLREACEDVGTQVLGVLRRADAVGIPSRHLGLIPAAERSALSVAAVEAMSALVAAGVDLDAVLAVARSAGPISADPWSPPRTTIQTRPIVALAGGPAFTFCYAEQRELLTSAGAEVVTFDPLRDEKLPPGTAAVIVGGGFPEIYAADLSTNTPLRAEMATFTGPIAAECAGLLWLGSTLDGQPMCGVLKADAVMTDKLTLGYRDAVAISKSVLMDPGTRVTGHEFHRTTTTPQSTPTPTPAWSWSRSSPPSPLIMNIGGGFDGVSRPQPTDQQRRAVTEGFVQGNIHASYLHTHWAAHPSFAERLVSACA